jgi:hypothetical protein
MEYLNLLLSKFTNNFDALMKNKTFSTFIIVFITLYASSISPKLPSFITLLFKNTLFKIIFIFIIAYRSNENPQLSLLFAIIFVLTINAISDQEFKLALHNIEKFQNIDNENNIYYNDNYISDCSSDVK